MTITNNLEIIHESEELIAINKPHGLLVHRSRIASEVTEFALQKVRDYVGHYVYPLHRLDRKTSGVLLFAKSEEINSIVQKSFREHKNSKTYLAIVRGYIDDALEIDYPLTENNKTQDAFTKVKPIQQFELNLAFGKFSTSRYTLLEIKPTTGRFHQIRKHMKHIFHPILGDRPHGCNKQNKLWKERFDMTQMMLHASKLKLEYPKGSTISIHANASKEFERVLSILQQQ